MDSVILFISESFQINARYAQELIKNFSFVLNNKTMNMSELCHWCADACSEFYVKVFNNREIFLEGVDIIMLDDKISSGNKVVYIDELYKEAVKNLYMLEAVENGFIKLELIEDVIVSSINEKGFKAALDAAKTHLEGDSIEAISTCMSKLNQYSA